MYNKIQDPNIGNVVGIICEVFFVCVIVLYSYSIVLLIVGKKKSKLLNKKEMSNQTISNKQVNSKNDLSSDDGAINEKKNNNKLEHKKLFINLSSLSKNKLLLIIPIVVIVIGFIVLNNGVILFDNMPVKNTGKYMYYINDVIANCTKGLRKVKYKDDSYNAIYTNVVYEKETNKQEMLQMSNDKSIAEYLIFIIDQYDIENGEIADNIKESNFYLCSVSKSNFRQVVRDQLVGNKDIIESLIESGKKGAAGAAGGAIGAIGGFLYGAGSTIADNFNNDKISINQVISELPDSVYKENFNILPGYEKPKVSMAKSKDLDKYLDEKQLNNLKNATKKFDVNE